MPKAMHESLKKGARKKGLTKKQENRYIYGTMNKKKGKKKKGRKQNSYEME